jgi:hypothetical protein
VYPVHLKPDRLDRFPGCKNLPGARRAGNPRGGVHAPSAVAASVLGGICGMNADPDLRREARTATVLPKRAESRWRI